MKARKIVLVAGLPGLADNLAGEGEWCAAGFGLLPRCPQWSGVVTPIASDSISTLPVDQLTPTDPSKRRFNKLHSFR